LHSRGQIYGGQPYLCNATPCVGMVANPALNDSRTAGIFILRSNDKIPETVLCAKFP